MAAGVKQLQLGVLGRRRLPQLPPEPVARGQCPLDREAARVYRGVGHVRPRIVLEASGVAEVECRSRCGCLPWVV